MPFMPRPIVLLALAVLAAAPAAAQETARPVDECGAPEARPRNRRSSQRRPAATRPEPRLLGQPAAPAASGPAGAQAQPGDAGAQAATPSSHAGHPSAAGTPSGAASQTAGQQTQPAGASSTATTGVAATQPAAGQPSAAGTPSGASSQTAGQQTQPAGVSSTAATGATQPGQASSMQAPGSSSVMAAGQPGTQASGQTANVPSYSGTGADAPPAPDAAKRNRDALRLGLGRLGDRKRLGPAASVSVPTAFGVDAGEVFFGVAYQGRTRYTEQDDAAAVVGFGIGTRRVVALEVALTTYSTFRSYPLETGGLSFKVHRAFPRQTSVAIGYENAILWGGSDDNGSLYAVATRLVNLRDDDEAPFSTAVFTLGLGNGRFRFEEDDAEGNETVNLFAAAGARVSPHVSLVADWTGQDLNMAASLTPLRHIPLVVTVGLADITGTAGDGARFILSLGYGLAFRMPL